MSQTKTEKPEREAFKKGQTGLDAPLIDQWIAEHYEGPQDILGKEGLLAQLTKAVVERALSAELTHHLGYAPGGAPAEDGGNCRNGTSAKTLLGEGGPGGDRGAARPPQQEVSGTLCLGRLHVLPWLRRPGRGDKPFAILQRQLMGRRTPMRRGLFPRMVIRSFPLPFCSNYFRLFQRTVSLVSNNSFRL